MKSYLVVSLWRFRLNLRPARFVLSTGVQFCMLLTVDRCGGRFAGARHFFCLLPGTLAWLVAPPSSCPALELSRRIVDLGDQDRRGSTLFVFFTQFGPLA